MAFVPERLGSGRVKRPRMSKSLGGGLMAVRRVSGVLAIYQRGREDSSVSGPS